MLFEVSLLLLDLVITRLGRIVLFRFSKNK